MQFPRGSIYPSILIALATPLLAHTTEEQKLVASDGAAGDLFGRSVAVDDETILVGATGAAGVGAAYVFVHDGAEFHEEARLASPDGLPGDLFGTSVAIRGDTAVVGAPGHDAAGQGAGAVYVFTRTGSLWSLEAKLLPASSLAGDQFGKSVSLDGDALVVGAPQNGVNGQGAAFVFVRSGSAWSQEAALAPVGAQGNLFGTSVGVFQDRLVVGMLTSDGRVAQTGAAFVFERGGAGWAQTAKLQAADGDALDFFGISVAIFNDAITVGASGDDDGGASAGAAYNFIQQGAGWVQASKRTGNATGDLLGSSVSRSVRSTLIGARQADDEASNAGTAQMFAGGVLIEVLVASDAAPEDLLGGSVAAGPCWQVAGAWGNDELGENAGAAYAYVLVHASATTFNGSGTNPALMTTIEPPAIGQHWAIEVDATAYPSAGLTTVFVYERVGTPVLTTFGEILVDLGSRLVTTSSVPGTGLAVHEIAIPDDPFLLGFQAAAQALVSTGGPGFPFLALSNAEGVVIGCPEGGAHHP